MQILLTIRSGQSTVTTNRLSSRQDRGSVDAAVADESQNPDCRLIDRGVG
jgi:hypothetical protein